MMKRILLFVTVAISCCFLLTSCMVRRGSLTVTGYHYWYYPSIQVYFDYERKVYYYPENGGWHHSSYLPSRYSTSSSYVILDDDSDKPYVNHEKHIKKYNSKWDHRKNKQRDRGDNNRGKEKDNWENER